MIGLNWRYVYWIALGLKFYFALSDSYIHPDEHYQNFQVLTRFPAVLPWEFSSVNPARSFGPLYLIYGPVLSVISFLGIEVDPLHIWYIFRLQFCLLTWVVTDWSIHRLLPSKTERVKALFFTSTSYVTLVYQSHCFSNSIETLVLLLSLVLIEKIRFSLETSQNNAHNKSLFWLGISSSFGVFNRITFPAFLIIPGWFLLIHFKKHKRSVFAAVAGFAVPSFIFIVIDTYAFGSPQYIVTPWNNLVYNSKTENLSAHGLHPYYTHVLVNLPQIIGPGLLLSLHLRNSYKKCLPFLSAISGLFFLSIIPHQELRFLIPILPLLCCCFDLKLYSATVTKFIIFGWYVFNVAMSVLMGIFHQGGVVPVLDHLYHEDLPGPVIQVWWRTYMPPTWMLGKSDLYEIFFEGDLTLLSGDSVRVGNVIIDLMGADIEIARNSLQHLRSSSHKVLFVLPVASFHTEDFGELNFNLTYKASFHLDLDHLDFTNMATFQPGLGVYELI